MHSHRESCPDPRATASASAGPSPIAEPLNQGSLSPSARCGHVCRPGPAWRSATSAFQSASRASAMVTASARQATAKVSDSASVDVASAQASAMASALQASGLALALPALEACPVSAMATEAAQLHRLLSRTRSRQTNSRCRSDRTTSRRNDKESRLTAPSVSPRATSRSCCHTPIRRTTSSRRNRRGHRQGPP